MSESEPSQGKHPLRSWVAGLCLVWGVACVTVFSGTARGNPCELPLKITEIHVDGLKEPDSEWFELTNPGAEPIDLSAWTFTDQATQGAATEGAIRFTEGLVLMPFASIIVAYDGAQFLAEHGRDADYEYGVDSVAAIPYLSRPSDWSSARTLSLSNNADELLLVCDGLVRDAVRWGIASDDRLAAPSPPYTDTAPQHGPKTFERQAVAPWSIGPSGWVSSRCPSPGVAPNPNRAPIVQPARVLVPYGTPIEFDLPGWDTDADTTFTLDTAGLWGTLSPLDGGRVRYTPPATAVPSVTSFRFVAADACSTTHRQRVDLVIGPPACDPGQANLRFTEVAPDGVARAWVEIFNPGPEEVDLSYLVLGDTELGSLSNPAETGAVVFPPGYVLESQATALVAFASGNFLSTFGFFSDFEWFLDSDFIPNELPLDPRGGRATVALSRSAGRIALMGCDGTPIDHVVWGQPQTRWTAPLPPLPADPTPLSYERRALIDTDGPEAWFVQHCPSPGEPPSMLAAPVAMGASYPRSDLAPLMARFSASDVDSPTLTFRGWASAGELEVDTATGDFIFTPPGPGPYTIVFEASDGCRADQARVKVCVQTTEIIGNAEDEDCDGFAQCWIDRDGDGFGGDVIGVAPGIGCGGPGLSAVGGDCDDAPEQCGAACRPGLPEVCDGFDNDCSPDTVDGAADVRIGVSCDSPADFDECPDEVTVCLGGQVACPNNPVGDEARIEVCDPLDIDEDCDGAADDADSEGAIGKVTFYRDEDGDGRGQAPVLRCDPAPGFVALGGDCDDDPAQCGAACRPGLTESRTAGNCSDGYDNDCDTLIDTDLQCFSLVLCYLDRDGDGYGDFASETLLSGPTAGAGCAAYVDEAQPGRWVENGLDCDDDPAGCGAACHPDAIELCDGLNNDCAMATADGSGDPRVGAACDGPDDNLCEDDRAACIAGEIECVDVPLGDAARIERCDPAGIDEDCDGGANDLDPDGPPINALTFYADEDGDGFGDATRPIRACVMPAGAAPNALDCDDDPNRCGAACHPGLVEHCDGFDNDCDPTTNDGAADPHVGTSCDAPDDADQCEDDIVACIEGGLVCLDMTEGDEMRVEVCDESQTDEDCDGVADDLDPGGAQGRVVFYRDHDGDGFGDPSATVLACVAPTGHVANDGDCDDRNAGIHPDAIERGGNELDEDCDGQIACYVDRDGDGYAADLTLISRPAGGCGEGFTWRAGDCDDDPAGCGGACSPTMTELCDQLDNDCDGAIDEVCERLGVLDGGSGCQGGAMPWWLMGAMLLLRKRKGARHDAPLDRWCFCRKRM